MADFQGSTLFQPIASIIGVSVSQVNFVAAEIFSLTVAIIFRRHFSPDDTSALTRHVILIAAGLALGLFCFGHLISIMFGQVCLCYGIVLLWPRSSVQKAMFLVAMTYLILMHLYRFIHEAKDNLLDITGPLMICTSKLTMLGFGLSDGQKRDQSKLTDSQKKHAVRSTPSIVEFFSYAFHFQGLLAGPFTFYNDFIEFVEGHNIPSPPDLVKGKPGVKRSLPNNTLLVVKKLCMGIATVLTYLYLYPKVAFVLRLDDEFLVRTPFLMRHIYGWLALMQKKCMYYTGWQLGDAVCNASGFGFSGYDEQGRAKWDLCTMVDVLKIETATSPKVYIDNWNISTIKWLKYVCADRMRGRFRRLATYTLSAVWHGFTIGMYMMFLNGIIIAIGAGIIRKNVRPQFQGTAFNRSLYDRITWFCTNCLAGYCVLPFFMSSPTHVLIFMNSFYWCFHVITFIVIFMSAFGLWKLLPEVGHGDSKMISSKKER